VLKVIIRISSELFILLEGKTQLLSWTKFKRMSTARNSKYYSEEYIFDRESIALQSFQVFSSIFNFIFLAQIFFKIPLKNLMGHAVVFLQSFFFTIFYFTIFSQIKKCYTLFHEIDRALITFCNFVITI